MSMALLSLRKILKHIHEYTKKTAKTVPYSSLLYTFISPDDSWSLCESYEKENSGDHLSYKSVFSCVESDYVEPVKRCLFQGLLGPFTNIVTFPIEFLS